MSVTGFLKNGKIEKYDYNALENKPSESGGTGLTEEAKQALLTCFQKVAYIDANGQTYYQALYDALNVTPKVLTSIDASYTQSGEVLTTDSLDSLRKDIVVTAYYNDSTSTTVTDYSLSGNLTAGTSTVTVSYNGMTDTISVTVTAVAGTYTISNHLTGCTTSNNMTTIAEGGSYTATITASSGYMLTGATASVTMGGNTVTGAYSNGTISIANVTGDIVITVTAAVRTVSSISAVFTQGDNIVYTTDTLDSLKQYLVVTANYADGGSETVSDYTLSGTLTEGTSIITVSYGGKTVTFTVTVTHATVNTSPAITTGAGYRQNTKGRWYAQTGCSVTDAYTRKGTKITFYCPYTEENMPYSQLLMCIFDGTTFIDYFNVTFTSAPKSRDISEYVKNSNNIRFMLFDSGIPNCFAYDTDSGDIYFAGVNSPYYGMANINEANET